MQQIKFPLLVIFFFCLLSPVSAIKKEKIQAKLTFIDKNRLCLMLTLSNTSSENYFIFRPSLSAPFMPNRTTFVIKDTTNEALPYIGPDVNIKEFTYNDFVFIPAGGQDRSRFCMPKYYKLNRNIRSITYKTRVKFYRYEQPRGEASRDVDFISLDIQLYELSSNTLDIKWHPEMSDLASYPDGFAPYGYKFKRGGVTKDVDGRKVIVD